MLFYKCLKISLINFLNLPEKGAKRLFRLDSMIKYTFYSAFTIETQSTPVKQCQSLNYEGGEAPF